MLTTNPPATPAVTYCPVYTAGTEGGSITAAFRELFVVQRRQVYPLLRQATEPTARLIARPPDAAYLLTLWTQEATSRLGGASVLPAGDGVLPPGQYNMTPLTAGIVTDAAILAVREQWSDSAEGEWFFTTRDSWPDATSSDLLRYADRNAFDFLRQTTDIIDLFADALGINAPAVRHVRRRCFREVETTFNDPVGTTCLNDDGTIGGTRDVFTMKVWKWHPPADPAALLDDVKDDVRRLHGATARAADAAGLGRFRRANRPILLPGNGPPIAWGARFLAELNDVWPTAWRNVRGSGTAGGRETPASPPIDVILWHGGTEYSIGPHGPFTLGDETHQVLQAFLAKPAMSTRTLNEALKAAGAGCIDPIGVLRKLVAGRDAVFVPAVEFAGKKGRPYRVRVQTSPAASTV